MIALALFACIPDSLWDTRCRELGGRVDGGQCSPDSGDTGDGFTEPTTPDPEPSKALVFISEWLGTGNLSRLNLGAPHEAANLLCQREADALGLEGDFHAWISTDDVPALSNVTGNGPWYHACNPDIVAFPDRDALASLPLEAPNPAYNCNISVFTVWTGTRNGGAGGPNCDNWSSDSSRANGVYGRQDPVEWTQRDLSPCDDQRHLICFSDL